MLILFFFLMVVCRLLAWRLPLEWRRPPHQKRPRSTFWASWAIWMWPTSPRSQTLYRNCMRRCPDLRKVRASGGVGVCVCVHVCVFVCVTVLTFSMVFFYAQRWLSWSESDSCYSCSIPPPPPPTPPPTLPPQSRQGMSVVFHSTILNLGVIIWFQFMFSFLVILLSPVALSVLSHSPDFFTDSFLGFFYVCEEIFFLYTAPV